MNKSQSMKFGIVLKRTPSIQEYNKAQQIPIPIPITEKPSENIVKEMVLKIEEKINPPIEIFNDIEEQPNINPEVKKTLNKLLFTSKYKY